MSANKVINGNALAYHILRNNLMDKEINHPDHIIKCDFSKCTAVNPKNIPINIVLPGQSNGTPFKIKFADIETRSTIPEPEKRIQKNKKGQEFSESPYIKYRAKNEGKTVFNAIGFDKKPIIVDGKQLPPIESDYNVIGLICLYADKILTPVIKEAVDAAKIPSHINDDDTKIKVTGICQTLATDRDTKATIQLDNPIIKIPIPVKKEEVDKKWVSIDKFAASIEDKSNLRARNGKPVFIKKPLINDVETELLPSNYHQFVTYGSQTWGDIDISKVKTGGNAILSYKPSFVYNSTIMVIPGESNESNIDIDDFEDIEDIGEVLPGSSGFKVAEELEKVTITTDVNPDDL